MDESQNIDQMFFTRMIHIDWLLTDVPKCCTDTVIIRKPTLLLFVFNPQLLSVAHGDQSGILQLHNLLHDVRVLQMFLIIKSYNKLPQIFLNISYLNSLGIALHLFQDHPHGGVTHDLLDFRIIHGSLANFFRVRALPTAAVLSDGTVLVTWSSFLLK